MNDLVSQFTKYLDQGDRENCINLILTQLSKNKINVVTIYDEVLKPSLEGIFCKDKQNPLCIWEEHLRSSIVRTVLECCYPYVAKERKKLAGASSRGIALVVCPTQEYHEIGARMVADFFTICGFNTTFIGANTPQSDILSAISYINPQYVAVSVSSTYNLLAAKNAIQKMNEVRNAGSLKFKIVVGGQAFKKNSSISKEMGADHLLNSFDDILNMIQGDN